MKAVMISIRPKWCELIASGKKTIDVRKTRPKLDLPFKCYIYCTNDRKIMLERSNYDKSIYLNGNIYYPYKMDCSLNGKVIGEFVCDELTFIQADTDGEGVPHLYNTAFLGMSCLGEWTLWNYLCGKNYSGNGWGWHISGLKIYDQPKKVTEFLKPCRDPYRFCDGCKHGIVKYPAWVETREDLDGVCYDTECLNTLHRPPQSWCYVEELK